SETQASSIVRSVSLSRPIRLGLPEDRFCCVLTVVGTPEHAVRKAQIAISSHDLDNILHPFRISASGNWRHITMNCLQIFANTDPCLIAQIVYVRSSIDLYT